MSWPWSCPALRKMRLSSWHSIFETLPVTVESSSAIVAHTASASARFDSCAAIVCFAVLVVTLKADMVSRGWLRGGGRERRARARERAARRARRRILAPLRTKKMQLELERILKEMSEHA